MPPPGLDRAQVVRVVDGDTVHVRRGGRLVKLRLIGVDTPEPRDNPKLDRDVQRSGRSRRAIQAMGRVASAFTHERLAGRTVGLEYDVERFDRYDRELAYVWLDDGTLFNAELLRAGQAQLLTIPPNVAYVEHLRACERAARAARRGLWANPPPPR